MFDWFPIYMISVLVLVTGISFAMFWVHVRRWTIHSKWGALREWAINNRFKLRSAEKSHLPSPLDALTNPPPRVCVSLVNQKSVLLQMDVPENKPGVAGQSRRWNVLVRQMEVDFPITALRPLMHDQSLVDLFDLEGFPALLSSPRFTVHGKDALAARMVVQAELRALLPHDLALILHGRKMILDFSSRPFDGIELSRVMALVDQLLGYVPAVEKAKGRS